DSFPKKFCIKPSKLTFMAYIPRFDCLDTFALRFIKDPYEFTDTTYSPTGVWVVPVLPSSVARLAPVSDIRIVNENGRKVTRVHIMGLEPTHGMGIQSGICTEMDSAGEYVGTTEASFLGYVTHKDTISGYIEITGATSTKKEWFGRRLEGVKLVRTVPY
ncbi:MAG: hypothetical protein RMJ33_13125, partial [Saprospiraceae bacterium]|nr:hypothetical protein [Saprospiraceae bacterium]